uniref:Membrane insertase YidC/Oxa/ALB C-terminal domain-containing protein n=1 Tax=Haptolina ericina TaxID=156174 RepID=A0A7S3B2R0_9EUKA
MDLPTASGCGSVLIAEAVDAMDPSTTTGSVVRQTEEAIRAASGELGWWGSYIKLVEDGIIALHDAFQGAGIPNAYGLAIFCFVLGVKVVTLPLNWNQLSSTAQMKAIKPQQDLVNEWYADNTQLKNMETGNLFERTNVNPLAGCLPSLAQIPVFLGVYYSVTSIAKAKVFTEGFLWIPNLSGPIADRREGISWLTEGWINGAPRFGWEDTIAYLTIPAILVCTQTAALYLLGSFEALDDKEETKSVALVLRILPLMLGWFAMNAPAGLGLYWVFNNILTTTQTAVVKKLTSKEEIQLEVSLDEVGPRRDPLPMASEAAAPDWVKAAVSATDQTTGLPAERVTG